jgi:2'-deoxynucleoside 5'-phosphate N-hydrolase
MKAYISLNTQSRKNLSKELIAIGMALNSRNVEQFIFVDKHELEEGLEKNYMEAAMKEIDQCNFMIIDGTNVQSINCIEMGYARARKKPIVYIHHEDSAADPMFLGLSHFHITYGNPKDLFDQMNDFLKSVLPQN